MPSRGGHFLKFKARTFYIFLIPYISEGIKSSSIYARVLQGHAAQKHTYNTW